MYHAMADFLRSKASKDGAQAVFRFCGNGVQLYGGTSLDYGLYNVTLDGGPPAQYSAATSSGVSRAQQLLVRQPALTEPYTR
jgi:hypothetical protein